MQLNDRRRVELAIPLQLLEREGRRLAMFANTDVGKAAIGLCVASTEEVLQAGTETDDKRERLKKRILIAVAMLQIPAREDDNDFPVRKFNVALAFLRDVKAKGYPYDFIDHRFSATMRFYESMIDSRAHMSDEDHKIEELAKELQIKAVKLGYYGA